eukprot:1456187-Rhodomonas_salina.1
MRRKDQYRALHTAGYAQIAYRASAGLTTPPQLSATSYLPNGHLVAVYPYGEYRTPLRQYRSSYGAQLASVPGISPRVGQYTVG